MADDEELEQLASDLYIRVVQPDLTWFGDLTPEMREAWLRAARWVLDERRLAGDRAAANDRLGRALMNWYDRTHGNEFGHDHHCPLQRIQHQTGDLYSVELATDACTCGWAEVIHAAQARSQIR